MTEPFYLASRAAGVVFDVSVALFAVGEFQQALRVRRAGSRTNLRDEVVFRLVFFAGILALPVGARLVPPAHVGGAAIFVVGTVIGWLGLVLRWWSFATLGRYFTTVIKVSADQVIVDRGPYRLVRHPGYTGLLFAFAGCGLMIGNWAAAVLSVAIIASALVFRLRREERALVAARGSAYLRYAEGRARLLPFIW